MKGKNTPVVENSIIVHPSNLPYFHSCLFCQLLGRTWLLGFDEAIQDPRPVPEPKHQGTDSVPDDLLQIPRLIMIRRHWAETDTVKIAHFVFFYSMEAFKSLNL